MDYRQTLSSSLQTTWIILKLIIPIYILANILFYYNTLSHISFLVEPITTFIGLPAEASLAIISGMFLNVYAAIAFAAPLDLSIQQWTILAVFIGICHSLIVEGIIMKKIGLSNTYSYILRFVSGFVFAYITSLLPNNYFSSIIVKNDFTQVTHSSLQDLLYNSFINSIVLSIKIIILITLIIFLMDFIKSRKFLKNSDKNISKSFSLLVGVFLGITYGAGVLIKEVENGKMSDEDIFYVGTFLLICHAIIEDTLLFIIFGADITIIIVIRTIAAIIISYILLLIYRQKRRVKFEKINI